MAGMTVVRLGWGSLRSRAPAFAATFLTLFLGATIVMAFASMLDTAGAPGLSDQDVETLTTVAVVVGGWGTAIVVFAVASTLTLTVRQRSRDMATLRSVGATPGQVGAMVVGEAFVIALVAAAAAILPAVGAGRMLLALLRESGQVEDGVGHDFGPAALSMGVAVTLVSALAGALIAARRTARARAAEAGAAVAADEHAPMGRGRRIAGWVFLGLSAYLAVMTVTVMHGKGTDAQQTAGSTSIAAAIGFALLAPSLVTFANRLTGRVLERSGSAAAHLAAYNMRYRTRRMASVLMPVILFVGIGVGTLYMQAVDSDAFKASGIAQTAEEQSIETLNYVVVGMLVVFAAIMIVNTLVAATTDRTAEFGRQRLAGATPDQVRSMILIESTVLAVTGVVFGTLAGAATALPFSYARTDDVLPHQSPLIWVVTAATALALTAGTAALATRKALRVPAVEAAANRC